LLNSQQDAVAEQALLRFKEYPRNRARVRRISFTA